MIVAGIGCRRDCPAAAIVALVRRAEAELGRKAERLAAPDFKRAESGLHAASLALGLPLVFAGADRMAAVQPLCQTRSELAERATGFASVAEAAALAVSGGVLLLARIESAGVTCALAGE